MPPPPRSARRWRTCPLRNGGRASGCWLTRKRQGRAAIIIPVLGDGRAVLIDTHGDVIYKDYERVTPRPDLPRMEWKVPDGEADQ